jgi:hypothetical protein
MPMHGDGRCATPITPRLFVRRHVDLARVNSALCS